MCTGLQITAGQRTMSGQKWVLTGQIFGWPDMLSGHLQILVFNFKFNCDKKVFVNSNIIKFFVLFMPILVTIGDFTAATTDDVIGDFTTGTSQ